MGSGEAARRRFVCDFAICNISSLFLGGFGAVYKVYDTSNKTAEYAMKVEKKLEKRKHSKLKMEVAILKDMNGKPEYCKHFTNIVDRGKKEKYFFIVSWGI